MAITRFDETYQACLDRVRKEYRENGADGALKIIEHAKGSFMREINNVQIEPLLFDELLDELKERTDESITDIMREAGQSSAEKIKKYLVRLEELKEEIFRREEF